MSIAFSDKEKEQIQKLLRESAWEFARTIGMKKTTVEQLTKAADISKGAFYLFYPSKEMLFFVVLEELHTMPLRAEGMRKPKAFAGGVLSGVVEPIGAVLTILAAELVVPALPYLLSFAAGAMLYVVVEELIPEMSEGKHSDVGTVFFAVGFSMVKFSRTVSSESSTLS